METIQVLAALITVISTGIYFIARLIQIYKMFKVNEVEIKQEAQKAVNQMKEQVEEVKEKVEQKIKPNDNEQPPSAQS